MSLAVENPVSVHVGNGATTIFPLGWTYTDESDVVPYLDDVAQTTGFEVSGTSAVFLTPPAAGVKVVLKRETPLDQPSPFEDPERATLGQVQISLNRVVRQNQEREETLSRVPQAAPGETPPGGSFRRAPNTTQGQDENGNNIARTPAQEREFLEIEAELLAATAASQSSQSSANEAASQANQARSALSATLSAQLGTEGALEAIQSLFIGDISMLNLGVFTASYSSLFGPLLAPSGNVTIGAVSYQFENSPQSPAAGNEVLIPQEVFPPDEFATFLAQVINEGHNFIPPHPQVRVEAVGETILVVEVLNDIDPQSISTSASSSAGFWGAAQLAPPSTPNLTSLPSVFLRADNSPLRLRAQ